MFILQKIHNRLKKTEKPEGNLLRLVRTSWKCDTSFFQSSFATTEKNTEK